MTAAILAMAAPLALAGLGGLLTELAGSLGIFLEGFMALGAFLAYAAGRATGSAVLACLAAALPAGLAGWLLARFVKALGANAFIAALAVNLAAAGLTEALSVSWYGTKGVLRDAAFPTVPPLAFAVLAMLATGALAFIVARTPLGLRLRAAGTAPEALRERGADPDRYRAGAWAAAAALAALGGAALSFQIGAYAPGGVAGRGWIALVLVYLGFRNPWGVAAGAIFFAGAEYAAGLFQGLAAVPATLLLGLPPALALILFVLSSALKERGKGKGKP